jgi:hypothetical protein
MKIKIVAVETSTATSKSGKAYQVVEATYKNMSFDGKVETKKHNSYGDKSVFDALKGAKSGDEFTIERKKDDAGYWQWIGIGSGNVPATSSATSSSAPAKATGGNWESSEERAKKQVYIVRQSSLGHAVETLKTDKKSPSADEVIELAKVYEAYVFGINLDSEPEKLPKYDEEDDLPY